MAEQPLRAAVLGHPISHSLSPLLHRAGLADVGCAVSYEAIDIDVPQLEPFLRQLDPQWIALSVTMPLKRRMLELATSADAVATATGAANTAVFSWHNGQAHISVHNTDVAGIIAAFAESGGGQPWRTGAAGPVCDENNPANAVAVTGWAPGADAVVLGAGATAASAIAALAALGWGGVTVLARDVQRAAAAVSVGVALGVDVTVRPLTEFAAVAGNAAVVISTLPQGGADGVAAHLAQARLLPGASCLDVSYASRPTPLGAAWVRAGGQTIGGERMLLHQAVRQIELYTGRLPDYRVMSAALERAIA